MARQERNRCVACGFTWSPGVDRSLACPRCGSESIRYAWTERLPAYAGCAAVAAFVVATVVYAIRLLAAYLGGSE